MFGNTRDYKTILQKKQRLHATLVEYTQTKNRFLLNKIEMYQHELKTFESDDKVNSDWEDVATIEDHFKIPIDAKTTSVVAYYRRVKRMIKLQENG
jgi:hypothetical protein